MIIYFRDPSPDGDAIHMHAKDGHKNTYFYCSLTQGIMPIIEILDIDDPTICRSQHGLLVNRDEAFRIAEKIDRKNSQYPQDSCRE